MAPEQATKQPLTPATDVYALGTLAYECLAGGPPFAGHDAIAVAMAHVHEAPPELPPDVPVAVRDVVMTAMAKDPAQRFATAESMAAAARRAGEQPTVAVPVGGSVPLTATTARFSPASAPGIAAVPRPAVEPVPPPRRPRRGVFAAIAGLAVVAAAVVVLLAAVRPDNPSTPPSGPFTSTSAGVAAATSRGQPGANGGTSSAHQSPGAGQSGKPTTSTKTQPAPAPSTTQPPTGPSTGHSSSAAPSASAGGGTSGGSTSGGGNPGDGTTSTPSASTTG
jgi:serine/threonine-protein kinase